MIEPKHMCRFHLLGEHNEIHKLAGSILRGKSLKGYVEGHLVQLSSMYERHSALIDEFNRRGYNHFSPLPVVDVTNYPDSRVDIKVSIEELKRRCDGCRFRIEFYEGV